MEFLLNISDTIAEKQATNRWKSEDGTRISTTRIKNSEIDKEGNLLWIDKKLV